MNSVAVATWSAWSMVTAQPISKLVPVATWNFTALAARVAAAPVAPGATLAAKWPNWAARWVDWARTWAAR